MPIVVASIGVIATVSISLVQIRSAEEQANAARAGSERMALAQQQLKILDLIKDKLFSNSEKDKKLAVQLLTALSPELAVKLASVISSDTSQSPEIRKEAKGIKELYRKVPDCGWVGEDYVCDDKYVRVQDSASN